MVGAGMLYLSIGAAGDGLAGLGWVSHHGSLVIKGRLPELTRLIQPSDKDLTCDCKGNIFSVPSSLYHNNIVQDYQREHIPWQVSVTQGN